MNFDHRRLRQDLTREESKRLKVYDDKNGLDLRPGDLLLGHPTIGVGRALDVRGLTDAEVDLLLENDIVAVAVDLDTALPWAGGLSDARQRALAQARFQLGQGGLLRFPRALAALEAGDFDTAADEFLHSHVARVQAPARWARLAQAIRRGVD